MRLYGELTKIEEQDDGTLKVFGVASSGSQDQVGETVLPEAVKAALPDYMAFAAVREMHQPSAAGTTLAAEVDAEGLTRIETHIVDPVAIRKVRAGVYKGFSLGGKTLARHPADRSVITAIRLNEISLVDRPCNPDAVIDLWKADQAADDTPAPYQPTNAEVKAEAYIMARAAGRPGRRNDYLTAAREALIQRHSDSDARKAAPAIPTPTQPNPPEPEPATAPPAETDGKDVDKLGARNSKADLDTIQAMHDHCVGLGAICEAVAAKAAPADALSNDLAKLVAERDRYAAALAEAAPRMEALSKRLDAQAAEIALLKAQPLPPKTAGSVLAVSVVDKTGDGGAPSEANETDLIKLFEALPARQRALIAMKAALASGTPVG